MRFLTYTLSFFLSIVLHNVTYAQDVQDLPDSLSLSDAIQIGLENNFDIRISTLDTEIAQNNNTLGAAGRWPTVTFNLSQGNNFRDVDNPASFLQGLSINNDLSPSLSVNWILFDGFRVDITKERLQLLEEQSMGNAQIVVENTIQAIMLAYYTTLLEKERLDVLEKLLVLSRDRYRYLQIKGELGSAVTFDILQEKNNYLTDSTNYVVQVVNFRNARRNLNLLMGVDVLNEYGLTDNLDVVPAEFEIEELYERMVSNNTNLRNQYLNQAIFRQDVRLAKTELYPSINLGLGASYNVSRQDLSNAELLRPIDDPITNTKTLNYFANFTLSYTLFDGGRIKRNIQNAYVNENIAQVQIEQLKLSLKNELVSVYDLYNSRKKLLDITGLNLETGDLNLALATERFKNGTINSFDFRTIQVNYLNTALNNVQAKYNLLDSEIELIRLTGGILEAYEVEYENN